MLDKLVTDALQWQCRNLIVDQQHGFCVGKSTVTNLMCFQSDILNALENGFQVDAVYTDFAKAFDRVDHATLLRKLEALGLGDIIVKWLSSFLSNRIQRVKIGNNISGPITVSSGVPQGSHCGPVLFLLFINDIGEFIKRCSFLMFADDVKLYYTITCDSDYLTLQDDLNNLLRWCNINKLHLNFEKCSQISFSMRTLIINNYFLIDHSLTKHTEIKDLGVIFDSKMKFTSHIKYISNKSLRSLGFVKRLSTNFSIETVRTLYCSLVRSHLEYASCIWSPFYKNAIDQLERVNNRFLRYISYRLGIPYELFDRNYIISVTNCQPLHHRRVFSDLCFIFRLIAGITICSQLLAQLNFCLSRLLRSKLLFRINFHSRNYGYNIPLCRMMRFCNQLANDINFEIFGASFVQFKLKLRRINLDTQLNLSVSH